MTNKKLKTSFLLCFMSIFLMSNTTTEQQNKENFPGLFKCTTCSGGVKICTKTTYIGPIAIFEQVVMLPC